MDKTVVREQVKKFFATSNVLQDKSYFEISSFQNCNINELLDYSAALANYTQPSRRRRVAAKKPVIYMYTSSKAASTGAVEENEACVTVSLLEPSVMSNEEELVTLYPSPNSVLTGLIKNEEKQNEYKWNTIVNSKGQIKVMNNCSGNEKDNNTTNHEYLFWESVFIENKKFDEILKQVPSYTVPSKEVEEFLEVILPRLGLNQRELNDFIVYWLPQLLQFQLVKYQFTSSNEDWNKVTSIKTSTNIEETVYIRVMMVATPLELDAGADYNIADAVPIDVEWKTRILQLQQEVKTREFERLLFVEWGGVITSGETL